METEKYYRLALNFMDGLGNATAKEILKITKTAEKAFTETDLWRSRLNKKSKREISITLDDNIRRLVETELEYIEKNNIRICHYLDKDYPPRLRRCNDSPLCIFYLGDFDMDAMHSLGIVGTRNATNYGKKCVTRIVGELKDRDICTVSGLAYGIDTFVHEESVNFNMKTIAVLGCGLKTIYPSTNKNLAHRIVDSGGAIVSEFPFNTGPEKVNFPKRNRIIAGLSDAVVVVESALKGGSIITANIANSYNRDVFAIPGSIFDENSSGCNDLIKRNIAGVITCGGDILEMMNWDTGTKTIQRELFLDLPDEEQEIYDFLHDGPRSIDEISANFATHTPSRLAGILLKLEIKGAINALPGKRYERT